MSLEKITSKILDEASGIKDSILSEAKANSDAILSEAKTRAEEALASLEKKGLEEKDLVIKRRQSVAQIDSKKVVLAKKQEIISDCFDKAVDQIIGMDQAKYINMLTGLGKASGINEGSLTFNADEKAKIGAKVVEGLNKNGGKFELAKETGNMRGGYILKYKNTFVDNTIEALVNEHKIELAGEVSQMLFGD